MTRKRLLIVALIWFFCPAFRGQGDLDYGFGGEGPHDCHNEKMICFGARDNQTSYGLIQDSSCWFSNDCSITAVGIIQETREIFWSLVFRKDRMPDDTSLVLFALKTHKTSYEQMVMFFAFSKPESKTGKTVTADLTDAVVANNKLYHYIEFSENLVSVAFSFKSGTEISYRETNFHLDMMKDRLLITLVLLSSNNEAIEMVQSANPIYIFRHKGPTNNPAIPSPVPDDPDGTTKPSTKETNPPGPEITTSKVESQEKSKSSKMPMIIAISATVGILALLSLIAIVVTCRKKGPAKKRKPSLRKRKRKKGPNEPVLIDDMKDDDSMMKTTDSLKTVHSNIINKA